MTILSSAYVHLGFEGDLCHNINDCQDSVCLNNGTCVDGINSFQCKCDDKYTGTYCQEAKIATKMASFIVIRAQVNAYAVTLIMVNIVKENTIFVPIIHVETVNVSVIKLIIIVSVWMVSMVKTVIKMKQSAIKVIV